MDFNIFFFFFFFFGGGGQKNEYFWGYEEFVDFFGGHQNSGLTLGVISMLLFFCSFFLSSLKVNLQKGDILGGCKI